MKTQMFSSRECFEKANDGLAILRFAEHGVRRFVEYMNRIDAPILDDGRMRMVEDVYDQLIRDKVRLTSSLYYNVSGMALAAFRVSSLIHNGARWIRLWGIHQLNTDTVSEFYNVHDAVFPELQLPLYDGNLLEGNIRSDIEKKGLCAKLRRIYADWLYDAGRDNDCIVVMKTTQFIEEIIEARSGK